MRKTLTNLGRATSKLIAIAKVLYPQVGREPLEVYARSVVNVQNPGDSHAAIAIKVASVDNTAYYVGLGFYIGALFCDTGDDNDQFMVVSPRRLRQSTLAAIIPQLKAKASDLETILHGTAVAVA